MSKRYKNTIVPIKVLSTTNGNSVTVTTEPGYIKRAIIAFPTPDNVGMVRASIEGNNGEKLAEMQAIDVYKNRNIGYEQDGIPMNTQGGGQLTFKILATANFNSDFVADLILIYGEEEPCSNY